ncbi:GNAT family N-acetyltransferase [Sulfurovum sp. zt1-1]|uniref:GNAT family N-acetyltransferase n=1 Tax=Sulfurovum zhangzhouensis TaxID=3019067 RepID=A0ABT7QYC4_9BACT|nr:GNAT family N-acetyltransferase [Sulfurovum zhangzhouensis]MDM5271783.1 GNAT family N-acetyltransferase [Sulfurovum zhangzhouensis]
MINFKILEEKNIHSIIPFLKILNDSISDDVLKERLDEMISQGYQCIGIFDDDELIGISGIWIVTKYYIGRLIEPDNVIISPEYQNKNIGHMLMEWIDDYAKTNGCVASEVNCFVHNERAHRFWEKEGYRVIAKHFQKKY